jgi:microcystin-dependent protein
MVIEKGAPMQAVDMLNMVFFPKGTVLMFNGADYTKLDQNIWKLCDGQGGRPDLLNKFIRGGSSSGSTGGGTVTLTEANLPSHTHSLSGLAESAGKHYHRPSDWGGESENLNSGGLTRAAMKLNISNNNLKTTEDGEHTHTISGTAAANSSHTSAAFNIVPEYYTLVYIIKVTDAGQ